MSMWTYINGSIEVETQFAASSPNTVKGYLDWVIKDLERSLVVVTGSEGPAIFTVVPYPYATGSSPYSDGYSKASIHVVGHLRDREGTETRKELRHWLESFVHYADIKTLCISVKGDMDESPYVYTDANEYLRCNLKRREEKARTLEIARNIHKYAGEVLLTPEKLLGIADVFKLASPDGIQTFMDSCDLGRLFSFKLSHDYKAYLKSIGIKPTPVNPEDVSRLEREFNKYTRKRSRGL